MTNQPELMLSCAVTYRESDLRASPLGTSFASVEDAIGTFVHVLLHEARDSLTESLDTVPDAPYLHPVDVDTDEPGIVASKKDHHRVLRTPHDRVARVTYARDVPPPSAVVPRRVVDRTSKLAVKTAEKELAQELRRNEKKAETVRNRDARKQQQRQETPEERETRLAEQREKRRRTKQAKMHEEGMREKRMHEEEEDSPPSSPTRSVEEGDDDLVEIPDASLASALTSLRAKRARGSKVRYFAHPLPHHRHLYGLQRASVPASLADALLRGTWAEHLVLYIGPPGTGKTRALVRDAIDSVPASSRIFFCAPTNVGSVQLYERCLAHDLGDETSLVLPPERVPPGTVWRSNDPTRRIVCATLSARNGPHLDAQDFDAVYVDEAAQCMEAWVWTLLRDTTSRLVLAGDPQQLPATTSQSGVLLKHDRSLLQRLAVELEYPNTTHLTVQHRMAPQILAFPNSQYYGGRLTCGASAPTRGSVRLVDVPHGREKESGTSYENEEECRAVVQLVKELEGEGTSVVVLCPYAAQCRLVLSFKTGVHVHTVDSFQGREADTVILSTVRDATGGIGFWDDPRRGVVALTRARTNLVVVSSNVRAWPETSVVGRLARWEEELSDEPS